MELLAYHPRGVDKASPAGAETGWRCGRRAVIGPHWVRVGQFCGLLFGARQFFDIVLGSSSCT